MNYEQLDQADLSGLERAAKDWRSVKSAYEGLGDDYDQRVRRRLERNWEGEAAAAARSEIVQVKKQMDAAAGEAGRMAKLLDDIHHDLHKFQKRLRTLEEEMQEKHLKVGGNGTIADHHPLHQDKATRHDPDMDDWRADRRRLVERYEGKIDDLLRKATEADETAETALKADRNGEEDETFTKAGHTTLEQVAQAEKDAERAAELMTGRPSPTELSELNKLLSKHGNDPVFAEKFARTRGADGTLQTYMTMMNPPPGSGHDQKKLLKKIQKNLGTTLGTATTVNSRAMDRFEKDLMAAGDHDHHSSGGRAGTHGYNGYQLTSSLMANGEWDSGFLDDFGTALIKEEQDRYQFWGSDRESNWDGDGSALGLIASDPMVGFSDALGHNPEAATDFLSGFPVGGGAGVDRGNAMNFMASVGQDPEAYKAVTAAQVGYTQGLVDSTLAESKGDDFDRVQDRVLNATTPGSSVAGIMSEARAEAVHEHKTAEAKDFNSTVEQVNKWVGIGVSTAAGAAASPVAGAAIGGVYGGVSELVVQHISRDYTAEGEFDAVATYASGEQSHVETLDTMVQQSAERHGYSGDEVRDMADNAVREGGQTFGAAAIGVHSRG